MSKSIDQRSLVAVALAVLLTTACGADDEVQPGNADARGPDAAAIDAAPPVDAAQVSTTPTVEPGCTDNGCVRRFEEALVLNISTIEQFVNNPDVLIENGATAYWVTFMSDGREITGMVIVPDVTPPPEGFATIVQSAPSVGIATSCTPSQGLLGPGLGGGLAVRGHMVFLVDLPGQLVDGPTAHLVRKVVGRAALDAARAGPRLSQALNVAIAKKSVIVGHSMGGYATMSAASEYADGYAAELDIRGFATAAPVGDMRGIGIGLLNAVDSPVFGIVAFYSWQKFYKLRTQPFVIEPFFSQLDSTLLTKCFTTSGGTEGQLWNEYPKNPAMVISPEFLAMATNNTWTDTWLTIFEENTAIPASANVPIVIFQGDADESVTEAATDFYVGRLRAAGLTIDYRKVPTAEHRNTAFGPITNVQLAGDASLAWVRERLAN